MNICIPYNIIGIGGPYTFVRLFSEYLKKRGHVVISDPLLEYDVLFIIAECRIADVVRAKRRGKPVVHRLDGVYYPALEGWKGPLYRFRNLRIQLIHNWLADHVVYQSQFCQQVSEQLLGTARGVQSTVYNGVNLNSFKEKNHKTDILRLVAFGKFRRTDQITPLLDAVKKLRIPYQFDIYGPYIGKLDRLFKSLTKEPSITYKGLMPHHELMAILPTYDTFLFSDVSFCPNAMLEAQAAGLAVVTYNRGGAAELIADGISGQVVPLPDPDPLRRKYAFSDTDAENFAEAIETIAKDTFTYRQRSRTHIKNHFSFSKMASTYEEILRSYQ